MNNNEAIAYATIALEQLKKEKKPITDSNLGHKMLSLMSDYSEKEIYRKYMDEE